MYLFPFKVIGSSERIRTFVPFPATLFSKEEPLATQSHYYIWKKSRDSNPRSLSTRLVSSEVQ